MGPAELFPPLRALNVPNVVTSLAAAAGLAGIALAFSGAPREALTCVFVSVVCDKLDGTLARRLGQTSELGTQLDSLADAVGFCVTPTAIAFAAGLRDPLAVAALLAYALAGIWRLAWFNVTGMTSVGSDERFTGIPTTVCASFFLIVSAALRLVSPGAEVARDALVAFFLVAAGLMVSAVPFRKRGLIARSLYGLLPLSLVALWWR